MKTFAHSLASRSIGQNHRLVFFMFCSFCLFRWLHAKSKECHHIAPLNVFLKMTANVSPIDCADFQKWSRSKLVIPFTENSAQFWMKRLNIFHFPIENCIRIVFQMPSNEFQFMEIFISNFIVNWISFENATLEWFETSMCDSWHHNTVEDEANTPKPVNSGKYDTFRETSLKKYDST